MSDRIARAATDEEAQREARPGLGTRGLDGLENAEANETGAGESKPCPPQKDCMKPFRAHVLELLLEGVITREAARSILVCHEEHPEVVYTDTTEGYHTIRDVVNLLGSNKKIEAIKKFRDTFHVGLRGAKEAVECIADIAFPPKV